MATKENPSSSHVEEFEATKQCKTITLEQLNKQWEEKLAYHRVLWLEIEQMQAMDAKIWLSHDRLALVEN